MSEEPTLTDIGLDYLILHEGKTPTDHTRATFTESVVPKLDSGKIAYYNVAGEAYSAGKTGADIVDLTGGELDSKLLLAALCGFFNTAASEVLEQAQNENLISPELRKQIALEISGIYQSQLRLATQDSEPMISLIPTTSLQ